jgi:hypothetical protein
MEREGPDVGDYILALLYCAGGRLSREKVRAGLYILAKRLPELETGGEGLGSESQAGGIRDRRHGS